MKIRHYNVIFNPEPEGGYTAIVPSLPGCVSYGKTLKEARKMIKDAISGYIISLKKHAVIPFHTKDLKPGTLSAILKEAGISREEFLST